MKETTFAELGLAEDILTRLGEIGYEAPTPVQGLAIPKILAGDKDIVALAHTGTGKTAAFGLPLIHRLSKSDKKVKALILCPTRELALQITRDLESYTKYKKVKILPVYGGAAFGPQIRGLSEGVSIVVATPGRILDLLNKGKADLSHLEALVLDEADEMLNLGFKDDLDEILKNTPVEKKTYLFSATMPPEIARIAKNYMSDPEKVMASEINQAQSNIKHIFYPVRRGDKFPALRRIVDSQPGIYGIVFCRTKRSVQELADKLIQNRIPAEALHGDLSQAQRDYVMHKFRKKALTILVATDVAARGIDIESLTHVIHYDLPDDGETYRHRSGRTGRAGKEGTSISLVPKDEHRKLKKVERGLGTHVERGTVPSGEEICRNQLLAMVDKIEGAQVDTRLVDSVWEKLIDRLGSMDRDEVLRRVMALELQAYLKEYEDAPDLTQKGAAYESRDKERGRDRGGRGDMVSLEINLGRRDKITVPKLLEIINQTVGRGRLPIGSIDLLKNHSRFEVVSRMADQIIRAFRGIQFHGRALNVKPAEGHRTRSHRSHRHRDRYKN